MHVAPCLVSQRELVFKLVSSVFDDISVLLLCHYAFVLPILEYYSPVWYSAASCHLQLVERQEHSVARLCPDQIRALFLIKLLGGWTVYVVQGQFLLDSLFVS